MTRKNNGFSVLWDIKRSHVSDKNMINLKNKKSYRYKGLIKGYINRRE